MFICKDTVFLLMFICKDTVSEYVQSTVLRFLSSVRWKFNINVESQIDAVYSQS